MNPILEKILLEILGRILTDEVAAEAKQKLNDAVSKAKADGLAYVEAQAALSKTAIDDFFVAFLRKVVS